VYHNDDRAGPGLLCYADGRCDVGLWKRQKLMRISSTVDDNPVSLSQLGYDVTTTTVAADDDDGSLAATGDVKRVARERAEILARCNISTAEASFDYSWSPDVDELAAAVLREVLPPSCLAADLKALDDAFNADDCMAVLSSAYPPQALRQSLVTIDDDEDKSDSKDPHVEAGEATAERSTQNTLTSRTDAAQPPPGGTTTTTSPGSVPDTAVSQPPSTSLAAAKPDAKTEDAAGSALKRRAEQGSLGAIKSVVPPGASTSPRARGPPDSAAGATSAAEAGAATQDGLTAAKADASAVHERSARVSPLQSGSVSGADKYQAALRRWSTNKVDMRRSSVGSDRSQQARRLSITAEGDAPSSSGPCRQQRLLDGIEAVLRGDLHASAATELGVDMSRPGPLHLLSERFIVAAGRGDVDTVRKLLEGGLVSVDVADSTGLTAIIGASVRMAVMSSYVAILAPV